MFHFQIPANKVTKLISFSCSSTLFAIVFFVINRESRNCCSITKLNGNNILRTSYASAHLPNNIDTTILTY